LSCYRESIVAKLIALFERMNLLVQVPNVPHDIDDKS
jgi:hypothetical protein